tara:strand:- start:10017 stop:11099 length:1083 start_codon:yes stop_codon:yes gene_type:complete
MGIYDQAASAFGSGLQGIGGAGKGSMGGAQAANGLLGMGGAMNPYSQGAANAMTGINSGQQAQSAANGMYQMGNGQNSTLNSANNTFAQTGGQGIVPQTMNQYLNPYQDQVVNSTINSMRDQEMQQLNNVRGQAAQAGAYGGARQALVESEVMNNSQRNMYDAVGGLNQQGFNTAAQFGQNRIGQIQNAAQGQLAAAGQQFAAQQGAAGFGLNNAGLNLNVANSVGNMGLASDASRQSAYQGAGNMFQNRDNTMLAAGQAGIGAAQSGMGIGNNIADRQGMAGQQQQQLMQSILNQASQQYGQYANYPQAALGTALSALQGNPMGAATTTTGTTTPGLFDYLSLGAGMGSSYLGGKGPKK